MNVLYFIPSFSSGGAEAFIVNVLENLDRNAYKLNLLCIDAYPGVYDNRLSYIKVKKEVLIKEHISNPILRYFKAYIAFKKYIHKNKKNVDVIHFNIAQGEDLVFIAIAKQEGVPLRLLHSHNSLVNSRLKYVGHLLCKWLFPNVSTKYLACSELAANWLIPSQVLKSKTYTIIKNGINTKNFIFNDVLREKKRRELGFDDNIVLFNIGRLNRQKNQEFLIEVFADVLKKRTNCILVIAGDGELKQLLKNRALLIGVNEKVMWLGNRNDISELLFAADVFLLPSLFEGLPFSVIEAQAAGLPCLISDTVSEECVITDLVKRIPLETEIFSQNIIYTIDEVLRKYGRKQYAEKVALAGFDIQETVHTLVSYYEE